MISYLRGNIIDWTEDGVAVLEVNGVGYEINVPARSLGRISTAKEELEFFTYMSVKEDGISLFGFDSKEEMQLFKKIISVSGVGPKGGLSILSCMNREQFINAVLSDDDAAISKANGIGKKTAQKIVLELKDKFSLADAFGRAAVSTELPASIGMDSEEIKSVRQDAIAALVALGYTNSESMKAVRSVEITPEMSVDRVLKIALKNI